MEGDKVTSQFSTPFHTTNSHSSSPGLSTPSSSLPPLPTSSKSIPPNSSPGLPISSNGQSFNHSASPAPSPIVITITTTSSPNPKLPNSTDSRILLPTTSSFTPSNSSLASANTVNSFQSFALSANILPLFIPANNTQPPSLLSHTTSEPSSITATSSLASSVVSTNCMASSLASNTSLKPSLASTISPLSSIPPTTLIPHPTTAPTLLNSSLPPTLFNSTSSPPSTTTSILQAILTTSISSSLPTDSLTSTSAETAPAFTIPSHSASNPSTLPFASLPSTSYPPTTTIPSAILSTSSTLPSTSNSLPSNIPASSSTSHCCHPPTLPTSSPPYTFTPSPPTLITAQIGQRSLRPRRGKVSVAKTHTRNTRRKSRPGESWCPVCGLTLRAGELEPHLSQELDKLTRLPQVRPLAHRSGSITTTTDPVIPSGSTSTAEHPQPSTSTHRIIRTRPGQKRSSEWQEYQRVRNNRRHRVREKRRKLGDDPGDLLTCPVCKTTEEDVEDIHVHIDECLRRVEEEGEDDVDVEEVEEYEWCGETRVRVTQMLRAEGQLHALGTKMEHGSEDEMVDVCEDEDVNSFGPSQYSQVDLTNPQDAQDSNTHTEDAHASTSHSDIDMNIDRIMDVNMETNADTAAHPDANTDGHVVNNSHDSSFEELNGLDNSSASPHPSTSFRLLRGGESAVVAALRARVRELEAESPRMVLTCRVCHGDYNKPLVSVICWHVQCEQCWMACLGTKRLCPQCNVITSPPDLRRIYL